MTIFDIITVTGEWYAGTFHSANDNYIRLDNEGDIVSVRWDTIATLTTRRMSA